MFLSQNNGKVHGSVHHKLEFFLNRSVYWQESGNTIHITIHGQRYDTLRYFFFLLWACTKWNKSEIQLLHLWVWSAALNPGSCSAAIWFQPDIFRSVTEDRERKQEQRTALLQRNMAEHTVHPVTHLKKTEDSACEWFYALFLSGHSLNFCLCWRFAACHQFTFEVAWHPHICWTTASPAQWHSHSLPLSLCLSLSL